MESALIEHPAVLEATFIGKPDPERTEIVKAFVVPRHGFTAGDDLGQELSQFVKKRLSAHAYPREIEFLEELPKTRAERSSVSFCATSRRPRSPAPRNGTAIILMGTQWELKGVPAIFTNAVSGLAKASPAGGIWRMMRVFQVESAWSDEKETTTKRGVGGNARPHRDSSRYTYWL